MRVLLGAVLLLSLSGTSPAGDAQSLQQENVQLRRRIERLENAMEELKKAPAAQGQSAGASSAAAAPSSGSASHNKDIESLRQENAELKQRLEKLEKALAASGNKASSEPVASQAKPQAPPAKPQPVATPAEAKSSALPAQPQPAPAPINPPEKKNVLSSLDIELYGYIKGDASYDSSRTYPGNYVVYVESEATRRHDNEFNLTANQTRLGMRIGGPATETFKTYGLVEIDFYGNYASENKAKIQMRLAYLVLDWPTSQFNILAGQAADIFSPLVPNTLNYTVLWDAGNIGYRRPQIRLTKGIPLGEKVSLKLEGGVARTIGRTDLTGSETGEDAGFPTAQGRVSMTFPFFGPKPTTVGFSGHFGQEEFDVDATGKHVNLDSDSINLDVTQPVFPWMVVLGELFSGQDLNEYFGGIGQGVNTTTLEEIHANGGWIAASLGPWSQWSFNVGAGLDEVDRDDVASGSRTRNTSIFGNVLYAFNKNAQAGLELSRWDTHYKGPGDADDLRAQASFIYKF
jgi:BMFP domain-containing protein YqiC